MLMLTEWYKYLAIANRSHVSCAHNRNVTDGQTDGRTDLLYQYRASVRDENGSEISIIVIEVTMSKFLTMASSKKVSPNNCDNDGQPEIAIWLKILISLEPWDSIRIPTANLGRCRPRRVQRQELVSRLDSRTLPLEPRHRCTSSVLITCLRNDMLASCLLTKHTPDDVIVTHALLYDLSIGSIFNDLERLDFKVTPRRWI